MRLKSLHFLSNICANEKMEQNRIERIKERDVKSLSSDR